MTLATSQKSSPSTVNNREISDGGSSPSPFRTNMHAATPQQITSILLADGWHDVQNCQLVQFALGEAQSPVSVAKSYPYLTYQENTGSGSTGQRTIYTPLGQVISFDITDSMSQSGSSKNS